MIVLIDRELSNFVRPTDRTSMKAGSEPYKGFQYSISCQISESDWTQSLASVLISYIYEG